MNLAYSVMGSHHSQEFHSLLLVSRRVWPVGQRLDGPSLPALIVSPVWVAGDPPFLPLTVHVAENQEFRGWEHRALEAALGLNL